MSKIEITIKENSRVVFVNGYFVCEFVEETSMYIDPFIRATDTFKGTVGGIYAWCVSADFLEKVVISNIKHVVGEVGWWEKGVWESGPSERGDYLDWAMKNSKDDFELSKRMRLMGLQKRMADDL